MEWQAAETTARRRAEDCDKLAAKEHELARLAEESARFAQDLSQRGELEELAGVHDRAAAFQTKAGAYYRGLADRIASHLVDVEEVYEAPPPEIRSIRD